MAAEAVGQSLSNSSLVVPLLEQRSRLSIDSLIDRGGNAARIYDLIEDKRRFWYIPFSGALSSAHPIVCYLTNAFLCWYCLPSLMTGYY